MSIAEKLTQIAENVPKVYNAGFEAGKAEEYVYEDVSLTELQDSGKLTVKDYANQENHNISEKSIEAETSDVVISISGYVEFELTIHANEYSSISIDGDVVYNPEQSYEDCKYAFKGNVNESIEFYVELGTVTFDRFVVKVKKDYDKGYADGKQSEYDRFWDKYQENGARTNYQFAFGGNGWTDETFKPKYDIIMKGNLNYAFASCKITDLISVLSESGVSFDCNGATNIQSLFQYSTSLTRVPAIDASALTANLNMVFYGCTALTYIEKIVVSEKTQFKDNTFGNCTSLTDITFEGVVGQNGLNLQWSTKLTAASLLSILTALSKDSTVASGKSITFATASQTIIEADTQCTQQYNLALTAGWEIKFA